MKNWHPTASIENLKKRAQLINQIRQFFLDRNILEVETPILDIATVTDPHLHSFKTQLTYPGQTETTNLYLQTSPEYAMKRLLAAGSGPIYQITKAFRNEECGRLHNPEFTMLEWYRPGFDHHQLMDEMDEFLQYTLNMAKAERLTYQSAFEKYLDINPHCSSAEELTRCVKSMNITYLSREAECHDRDTWLHLLMSHCIEPQLGRSKPTFIYDYPESQAALAKICKGNPSVAERFEVYIQGYEIANGFHELQDPNEQLRRFQQDLNMRKKLRLSEIPVDENFIASLENGLPACAGVALGVDRLIMLAIDAKSVSEVIGFSLNL